MRNAKYIVIGLILFIGGFFLGQSFKTQPIITTSDTNSFSGVNVSQVTYALKFSDAQLTEFQNVEITPKQTVLGLLQVLSSQNNIALETKDYGSLGVLVVKIGDLVNGQDNRYWQYYVNDSHPEVGADNYQLTGGERVEWRFETDQYNNK